MINDFDYGFCSEANGGVGGPLPDTPRIEHELLEVVTHIYPKGDCKGHGVLTGSPTRICTGHVPLEPTEYIFEVDSDYVKTLSKDLTMEELPEEANTEEFKEKFKNDRFVVVYEVSPFTHLAP